MEDCVFFFFFSNRRPNTNWLAMNSLPGFFLLFWHSKDTDSGEAIQCTLSPPQFCQSCLPSPIKACSSSSLSVLQKQTISSPSFSSKWLQICYTLTDWNFVSPRPPPPPHFHNRPSPYLDTHIHTEQQGKHLKSRMVEGLQLYSSLIERRTNLSGRKRKNHKHWAELCKCACVFPSLLGCERKQSRIHQPSILRVCELQFLTSNDESESGKSKLKHRESTDRASALLLLDRSSLTLTPATRKVRKEKF